MLSTPLISCSIGEATVSDTTSAVAPAKRVVTCTVGGAISGNSAIGNARKEMTPTSVRMIERTAAKIGLSMKKCDNFINHSSNGFATWAVLSLNGGFDFSILGGDLLPWPGPLQAVDHDTVR